jgi:SAM-dependent methyltransferase
MVSPLDERVVSLGLSNVETQVLDVYELSDSATFDAIVATNVLHLLPDVDAALTRMVQALVPGGLLVVPTFCHAQTWVATATSGVMGLFGFPGQRRLNLEGLTGLLKRPELRVEEALVLKGLLPIGFVTAERVAAPGPVRSA